MSAIPQPKPAEDTRAIRRVLLVDDSRLQRRILSASLARDGYDVMEASSGFEALEICKTKYPDLVLSDWMMPGMDGLAFCKAFRDLPSETYGYFILLTSSSEKADVVKGLENGADDFLIKPVNAHELRARISAGDRILQMQGQLHEKNRLISETLEKLQTAHEALNNDLIAAKRLQESLIPKRYEEFETGSISLFLQSSGHVGGDLVGHFRVNTHRIGVFAFDVSGHGVSSALMTARLAGYLSATSRDQNIALYPRSDGSFDVLPPATVVSKLNELFLQDVETELYFTMVLADIDLRTGQVIMTQAGHPHPYVLQPNGKVDPLGEGGLPVGLLPAAGFDQFDFKLQPGDRLIILSDGASECAGSDGELLGEDGLVDLLINLKTLRSDAMLETLVWQLKEFSGSMDLGDDVSGVVFEYTG